MPLNRLAMTVVAVVALAASSACASTSTSAGSPTPVTSNPAVNSAPTTAAALPSSSAGAKVSDSLQFTSTTVDGKAFDAASLAGKPTVLWFWAAWCPKCRAAAPKLAAVQATYAGKANVVGVAGLGSGVDKMARFISDTGIGAFPNLADDPGAVWKKFGVAEQEYYVLIDRSGAVVHKGPLTTDDLRTKINALVG